MWFALLLILTAIINGCAASKSSPESSPKPSPKPTPKPTIDPFAFKSRAESLGNGDVTVTVAVPTIAEAQGIYGVKLAQKNIQPVWVKVENRSDMPYWLLSAGLDPAYFQPSEVAFAFRNTISETRQALADKFRDLQFHNPVRPQSTKTGFVLVNLDEGFKAVDIDLLSRNTLKNFSFIVNDPDFKGDFKLVDFRTLYKAEEIIHITDDSALRRMLESLPLFTTNADGDAFGDPLNLVLIGQESDLLPALVRRNWHPTETLRYKAVMRTVKSYIRGERYLYSPISPLYVYGRQQDIGWQKARSSINERNHMRLWLSPIKFRGDNVYVGQISRDIGVKFTMKSQTISTHVIDPDVDEARRYFIEDMAFSQALAKVGFIEGAGRISRNEPQMNLVGDPFFTDGLRAVLFFSARPNSLTDIEILPWETPSGFFVKSN